MAERFYYGASYSPLVFPEADWVRDLEKMQSAGMNLIRLGDVHGSWDWIEPRPGELRLDRLGRFYEEAATFGIEILISTGASGPPLWLAEKYPDVTLLNNRGERYPLGASYHWACIHHPGYRQALQDYIGHLLAFTSKHPNHFGWQITNEIGFPFLPARGEGHLGLFCYCGHCQARFRDWAQEKHGTLDALTRAWAWGTSYLVYNDWSEIFAPESPPSAWASVTRWLDWRLFWQQAFAEFAGWQHDMIKAADPDHPTSINTFNFKGYDRFGVYTGLDQWTLAQEVDHIGYDLYPGSGDKLAVRPEHSSIFLDHGRSVAASGGRDFWLHEIESGPIGGWVMGPDHKTDAGDIDLYCAESLGHEAKLMLYMPWREWDYQPLHWGALVDLDGGSTPRMEKAGDIGRFIRDHEDFLCRARVPAAEAVVLESKANAIFWRGVDQDEDLFLAQRGAYRALWEAGYGVGFLNTTGLVQGQGMDCPQILLPMMGLIEGATARALADYVAGGGLLIGFARCGTLDEKGWFYHQWPESHLGQAFGIASLESDTLAESSIEMDGELYPGHWNRDLLTPMDGTIVLARFADGWPAVTLAQYGCGWGLYLATQADAAHLKHSPSLLKAVLRKVHQHLGMAPRLQVDHPQQQMRYIDPHLLEDEGQSLLVVGNYLRNEEAVVLSIRDERKVITVKQVYPLPADITWTQTGPQLSLSFSMVAKEVKIFKIDWN